VQPQKLTIDLLYTYEVTGQLEGGMGYVKLLTLVDRKLNPDIVEKSFSYSPALSEHFRYPYQQLLAAKTIKMRQSMPDFARECHFWLELDQPGVVPLLKVVEIDGVVYALMPQYSGSLRDLLLESKISSTEILRALHEPIKGLADINKKHKIVHQDIKPENFLYTYDNGKLKLFLGDWGIANVQASNLLFKQSNLSRYSLSRMEGLQFART
jgi:serine/threonine protein kinase